MNAVARTPFTRREVWLVIASAIAWALVVRPGPLSLPFFWDEADVYGPGAKWLAEHGLNATPGTFPDDWSRGHPPLFFLLAGVAFRLCGPSATVAHALILPFTALALACTYSLARIRFRRAVAICAAVLLGTSPLFLAMGAFLLPEMPLTGLTALALLLAAHKRYAWAAVVGVALVWIKETGLCTSLAICGALAITALRERDWRAKLQPLLISMTPILALAVFFAWQRIYAGYFVFPHHQNLFAERTFEASNVLTVFPSALLWHGRWVALGAAVVAAIFAWKRAPIRFDVLDVSLILLVTGNAIFFAKMFWLERYALPAHPGVCVLIAACLGTAASSLKTEFTRNLAVAAPGAAAAVLGLLSLHRSDAHMAPELTFAFVDVVHSHERVCQELATLPHPVVLTTWPLTTELREPWLGYVHAPIDSIHLDNLGHHPDAQPNVVVVERSSPRAGELRVFANSHGMQLRSELEVNGSTSIELWR